MQVVFGSKLTRYSPKLVRRSLRHLKFKKKHSGPNFNNANNTRWKGCQTFLTNLSCVKAIAKTWQGFLISAGFGLAYTSKKTLINGQTQSNFWNQHNKFEYQSINVNKYQQSNRSHSFGWVYHVGKKVPSNGHGSKARKNPVYHFACSLLWQYLRIDMPKERPQTFAVGGQNHDLRTKMSPLELWEQRSAC